MGFQQRDSGCPSKISDRKNHLKLPSGHVRGIYKARTPLVLGTSSPPVRVIAIRIARARALNAASALLVSQFREDLISHDSHVVIVVTSNVVNVKCDTSGEGERLQKMGDHLGRHCH